MKIRTLLLLAIPLMLTSCANGQHKGETIEMNNGQKWKVNEEMKPHIEKGREILNTYLDENSTDHKALAENLQEQNSNLIGSCTMDGKSHDELHKWLHPHLEMVKALKDAETDEEVTKVTKELKASYDLYDQHFE